MVGPYKTNPAIGRPELRLVLGYMATAGLVLLLMMLFGLLMRMAQGNLLSLDVDVFYELLTLHGTGMVGAAAMVGGGIMWYFLREHEVPVSLAAGWINLGLFLAGVVLVIASVAVWNYAGAWTFLYPLPANPMGVWGNTGAAAFLIGLLLIGVGFLILHFDVARAIIRRYGGLSRGLGWPQLFGKSQ